MSSLKTLALALLLTSLAMAPAYAKRHGGDSSFSPGYGRIGQLERLKEALELTPQQQTEIRTILSENRKDMTARRAAARANREAVRDTLAQTTLDEPRLRQLLLRQSELLADRMVAQHAVRARIKQYLTVEQQSRWEEFRRQRIQHRGGHDAPDRGNEAKSGATAM